MVTPKVHILLSTYNGEKYLFAQLDSIFNQTYKNFTVFIRDDGSTDNTVQLIHSYIMLHPNYANQISLLPNETCENIGYRNSFWQLLINCPSADYYAFCDQDDVWLPNKLQKGITFLLKEKNTIPLLFFSGFYQCNENLTSKRPVSFSYKKIELQDVLFYTPAYGFTIMINNPLRQLALRTKNHFGLPHDGWLQKIAASFGKIIYSSDCTTYYRRHEKAVTSSNKNTLFLLFNWIHNDIFGPSMKETHYVLNRFYNEYGSSLNTKDKKILSLFATNESSFSIWWQRIFYFYPLRPSWSGRLALKICFILNTY